MVSDNKTRKKVKIHLIMAQTTPGASFGPVLIVTAFPNPPRRVFHTLQPTDGKKKRIKHELVIKNTKKKKKRNLSVAQTTRLASFGPVFVAAATFHKPHHSTVFLVVHIVAVVLVVAVVTVVQLLLLVDVG
jgi:hypothetical protein